MFNNLKDLDQKTLNDIQWNMTPEEAIALHLEWGPLRSQAYYNSRDSDNETIYFIVNTWKDRPTLQLIRRKGFDMYTIGEFVLPEQITKEYEKLKGVFSPDEVTVRWIKEQIG